MSQHNKLKIVNDPIYGFITIPEQLVFDLIEHPYFQRLRRISQMGMSYLVYPGAHHTRFHHALGAMHLMQRAILVLRKKGINISEEEEEGLCTAILLHDIGHGPFSHAMEHSIVEGISHEEISLHFMRSLNEYFNGALNMALEIFTDNYHRKFFHQLVAGQLDMDRLDYLRRDSFYTGVAEGTISSERLITMLNVYNDQLVVEEKGIYSVEKFLVARRLMYWQVYLHKTGIVAEQLLVKMLQRAKELVQKGVGLSGSKALLYFLNKSSEKEFTQDTLEIFASLDDYDIISAMKAWQNESDFVLSKLCDMILNRKLLKIKMGDSEIPYKKFEKKLNRTADYFDISKSEAKYFVFTGSISNQAYSREEKNINLLTKSGKVLDVAEASDQFNLRALSNKVVKYYLCYPNTD